MCRDMNILLLEGDTFNYKFYSYVPDLIRVINDPEHPLTLEELNVIVESNIKVRPVIFRDEFVRRYGVHFKFGNCPLSLMLASLKKSLIPECTCRDDKCTNRVSDP